MINLNFFKQNIIAHVPGVAQVVMPERVQASGVDTSALLTGIIEPYVDDRIYPYKLPDRPVYPAMTYEQSGSHRAEIDGYIITNTDRFLVSTQTRTLDDLINLQAAVNEALIEYDSGAVAGGIEILDQAITWHDEPIMLFEAALEIGITHLALPSQALPAVFIYPLQDIPRNNNQSLNCVEQQVESQFVSLIVATVPETGVTGIEALRKSINAQIINQYEQGNSRTEFIKGHPAALVGSMVIWRDVFSATSVMSSH